MSFIDFYCLILLPSLTSDLPQLARLDTAPPARPQATPPANVIRTRLASPWPRPGLVLCGILTGKSCTRRTLLYLLPFLIPPRSRWLGHFSTPLGEAARGQGARAWEAWPLYFTIMFPRHRRCLPACLPASNRIVSAIKSKR